MNLEWNNTIWEKNVGQFAGFINELIKDIGRSERREAAAYYVRGLLGEGERKSIEPMARRLGVDKQKLQQFLADSPWDEQLLWKAIRKEVIPAFEPLGAWIVDETGWLKQGDKSVGVRHQYCGAAGKQANCQVSVEVVVSNGHIVAPVGGCARGWQALFARIVGKRPSAPGAGWRARADKLPNQADDCDGSDTAGARRWRASGAGAWRRGVRELP
jgi:hypothetical protein